MKIGLIRRILVSLKHVPGEVPTENFDANASVVMKRDFPSSIVTNIDVMTNMITGLEFTADIVMSCDYVPEICTVYSTIVEI